MESRNKKLRSGYTTGACAAAAAKAATLLAMRNALCVMRKDVNCNAAPVTRHASPITDVELPFPDGSRHRFAIHRAGSEPGTGAFYAVVKKDAGDDPDVTNGAEIMAETTLTGDWGLGIGDCDDPISHFSIELKGGAGVGRVTKPGLSVPVGEPAINPVPRKMIAEAVEEAISEFRSEISNSKFQIEEQSPIPGSQSPPPNPRLVVTISVPMGEELAKKTLNSRLGIVGGISILGTTGIVRPLSTEAWTASISASMDVARAMGCNEIVISAGRTSERAHMRRFRLPEEAYVMMGDYLDFSLSDAKRHGFTKIHLCAQWAKMLKTALSTPQTHVRHGVIDLEKTVDLLTRLGISVPRDRAFNTAREIFDFINTSLITHLPSPFLRVCEAARQYAEGIAELPVAAHLVSYGGEIVATSESRDKEVFSLPLCDAKVPGDD